MKRNLKLAVAFLAAALMTFASCNKKAEAQDTSSAESKTEKAAKNAKPNPESDFEIKISDDLTWVRVTGYVGKSKKIVVPETIQGLPVLSVSLDADEATLVVIPSTAKVISVVVSPIWKKGKYADVVLPEGLLVIEYLGGKISSPKLPSTVKYITKHAFSQLRTKELILPASLEYIGDFAFDWNWGGYDDDEDKGIDKLTLPSPSRKLFFTSFFICKNLSDLPENLEKYRVYESEGSFGSDYHHIISPDKDEYTTDDFIGWPFKRKVEQSVELKKKFYNRKISAATKEELTEFEKSVKETLSTLPKELADSIYESMFHFR